MHTAAPPKMCDFCEVPLGFQVIRVSSLCCTHTMVTCYFALWLTTNNYKTNLTKKSEINSEVQK